jgi:hypothetical protein
MSYANVVKIELYFLCSGHPTFRAQAWAGGFSGRYFEHIDFCGWPREAIDHGHDKTYLNAELAKIARSPHR